MAKLSKGALVPDCYLIPDGIVGHPNASCPYGDADDPGDLKAARQLVQASGTVGLPGRRLGRGQLTRPRLRALLHEAPESPGLRRPDRGGGDAHRTSAGWVRREPIPRRGSPAGSTTFRTQSTSTRCSTPASSARPGSPNAGHVNDLFIQQQLEKLSLVPAQDLGSAAGEWRDLDEYAAQKAYLGRLRHAAGAKADQRHASTRAPR